MRRTRTPSSASADPGFAKITDTVPTQRSAATLPAPPAGATTVYHRVVRADLVPDVRGGRLERPRRAGEDDLRRSALRRRPHGVAGEPSGVLDLGRLLEHARDGPGAGRRRREPEVPSPPDERPRARRARVGRGRRRRVVHRSAGRLRLRGARRGDLRKRGPVVPAQESHGRHRGAAVARPRVRARSPRAARAGTRRPGRHVLHGAQRRHGPRHGFDAVRRLRIRRSRRRPSRSRPARHRRSRSRRSTRRRSRGPSTRPSRSPPEARRSRCRSPSSSPPLRRTRPSRGASRRPTWT